MALILSMMTNIPVIHAQNLYEEKPTFVDDFDGNKLNKNIWIVEERQYKNRNVYFVDKRQEVRRGKLILTLVKEHCKNCDFTGGSVYTKTQFGYGKLEVRAKVPANDELWPAMWLKATNWKLPLNGEIDILEHWRKTGKNQYQANFHLWGKIRNSGETHVQYPKVVHADNISKWHIYTMINTPDSIVMEIDHKKVAKWTPNDVVDWPINIPYDFRLSLNCSTWAMENVNKAKALPQKMLIDWVRFYKMK